MKIAIIGAGNIGSIYARSFIKHSIVKKEDLFLLDKHPDSSKDVPGRWMTWDSPELKEAEVFIISVKPQDFSFIADNLKKLLSDEKIILSVMAGITISRIRDELGHSKIVRAMPNAPIAFGLGMTGFCAWEEAGMTELKKVENLLSCNGRTIFFHEENKMDAVTALSGSGPAYFYYFVKAMTDAGKELGFDEAVSSLLVKQTMLGAFHLMNSSSDSLDELISTVASKGGTNEAALEFFDKFHLSEGII
jgi:pyrroline-5-carboxylate reductase